MTDSNCLPMMMEKELLRSVSIVNDELESETTSQQQQYQNEDDDALAASITYQKLIVSFHGSLLHGGN